MSTVRELHEEWAQRAAKDAGQLVSVTLARLELEKWLYPSSIEPLRQRN